MTTSTHLRQVASRTGLDSIAEALPEGANTIEQHEGTIARRDAVIKLLEGEVAQAHEARKQAQAQAADLKGAVLRAETNAEQYANALLLKLVADIRFACGDNGKRMQPELVEHIKAITANAERYQLLRRGQHWSVINGIGDALRAEALDAAIDAARKDTK